MAVLQQGKAKMRMLTTSSPPERYASSHLTLNMEGTAVALCIGSVLCSEFAPMVIKETSNVSNATDKAALIQLHSDCFHMYVNVNPGDRAIWDEHATAVHGVKATDECMKSKMRRMV